MAKTLADVNFVEFSRAAKKALDDKLDSRMEKDGIAGTLNKFEEVKKAFNYVIDQDKNS